MSLIVLEALAIALLVLGALRHQSALILFSFVLMVLAMWLQRSERHP